MIDGLAVAADQIEFGCFGSMSSLTNRICIKLGQQKIQPGKLSHFDTFGVHGLEHCCTYRFGIVKVFVGHQFQTQIETPSRYAGDGYIDAVRRGSAHGASNDQAWLSTATISSINLEKSSTRSLRVLMTPALG